MRVHIFEKRKCQKKALVLTAVIIGMCSFVWYFSTTVIQATRVSGQERFVFRQEREEQLNNKNLQDTTGDTKKIALTFDDGPNPDYTESLLAGLRERDVHATFFLLGVEVEKYPEIVEDIKEDGHLIGVHAYEHVNLSNLTDKAAIEQVDKTNHAIYEVTGEYAEYIRPPYGCWKCNLDYQTNMIEVLWDIDPLDWKTSNSAAVVKRVVTKCQENDIILLHDAYESSVAAALEIIDTLQEQGYEFVTVDELILE